MFSLKIINSDMFLDMPLSSQSLYFHLSMRADDEGFLNNAKTIQRMVGANVDDLKLLLAKRFILEFESGVIVIKHWLINNNLRSDRLRKTTHEFEKKMLQVKANKAYTEAYNRGLQPSDNQVTPTCQPNDNHLSTKCHPSIVECSVVEGSIGEDSIKERYNVQEISKKENFDVTNENIRNVTPPKRKKIRFDDVDMALTQTMLDHVQIISGGSFKKPKLDVWANEFRLMRERDNRSPEKMFNLINLLSSGTEDMWTFWRKNILSPQNMRKSYDRIVAQYKNEGHNPSDGLNFKETLDDKIKQLATSKAISVKST